MQAPSPHHSLEALSRQEAGAAMTPRLLSRLLNIAPSSPVSEAPVLGAPHAASHPGVGPPVCGVGPASPHVGTAWTETGCGRRLTQVCRGQTQAQAWSHGLTDGRGADRGPPCLLPRRPEASGPLGLLLSPVPHHFLSNPPDTRSSLGTTPPHALCPPPPCPVELFPQVPCCCPSWHWPVPSPRHSVLHVRAASPGVGANSGAPALRSSRGGTTVNACGPREAGGS